MDFMKSKALLEKYGINFVKGELVKKESELPKLCKKLGFPLAMKIVSKQILHKTDVGGVILNIENEKQAFQAFNKIKKNVKQKKPKAKIDGIFVQQFIKGREIIIGGKKDEQFGQTILFGLGGIFVELLKDVSIRICPIERKDAKEMISEIKGYPILKGLRGQKPINFKKLEDTLLKVNKLLLKEKVNELDINPLIASGKDLVAVDARIL